MAGEPPQSRLQKALNTINQLTISSDSNIPIFLKHFLSLQSHSAVTFPRGKVWVRDLITNKWEGPWDLITWGHGYVSPQVLKPLGADVVSEARLTANLTPGQRWIDLKPGRVDLKLGC